MRDLDGTSSATPPRRLPSPSGSPGRSDRCPRQSRRLPPFAGSRPLESAHRLRRLPVRAKPARAHRLVEDLIGAVCAGGSRLWRVRSEFERMDATAGVKRLVPKAVDPELLKAVVGPRLASTWVEPLRAQYSRFKHVYPKDWWTSRRSGGSRGRAGARCSRSGPGSSTRGRRRPRRPERPNGSSGSASPDPTTAGNRSRRLMWSSTELHIRTTRVAVVSARR